MRCCPCGALLFISARAVVGASAWSVVLVTVSRTASNPSRACSSFPRCWKCLIPVAANPTPLCLAGSIAADRHPCFFAPPSCSWSDPTCGQRRMLHEVILPTTGRIWTNRPPANLIESFYPPRPENDLWVNHLDGCKDEQQRRHWRTHLAGIRRESRDRLPDLPARGRPGAARTPHVHGRDFQLQETCCASAC